MESKFFDTMKSDIMKAKIPEAERNKLLKNYLYLKDKKINLMITGATGCGKSSTINALFNIDSTNYTERAKVGVTPDPETMSIERYELDNLVLWDSPGLGDGKEADNNHARNIIRKLNERDENGDLLIDLVLVILDGSTRDLGTSYELINEVIIPNLGKDPQHRILVAINQADMAMKGKHWNSDENKPDPVLIKFLDEKAASVKKRIKEGTGIDVDPIYYSAGFKEEGLPQTNPYNLAKLLFYIIQNTPQEKRLVYIDNINKQTKMWKDNDDLQDYRKSVIEEFAETFTSCISRGTDIGGSIGSVFGGVGRAIGSAVGGVVGAVTGAIGGLISGLFSLF